MPRSKRSYRALRRQSGESDSPETDDTDYSGGLDTSSEESGTSTDTDGQLQGGQDSYSITLETRDEQDDHDIGIEKGFRLRRTLRESGRDYTNSEAPDYSSLVGTTARAQRIVSDEESESTASECSSSDASFTVKPRRRQQRGKSKSTLGTLIKYMILAVLLVLCLAFGAGYFSYRRQKRIHFIHSSFHFILFSKRLLSSCNFGKDTFFCCFVKKAFFHRLSFLLL